jgi:hypothetical protein
MKQLLPEGLRLEWLLQMNKGNCFTQFFLLKQFVDAQVEAADLCQEKV